MEEVPGEGPDYDLRVTRHFLTGEELTSAELRSLLDRAARAEGRPAGLAGAARAAASRSSSTSPRRARGCPSRSASSELGGHPVVLREGELQLSRGESPRDTAQVLSRLVHAIGVRTGPHATVEELAAHSDVPVVNLLTRDHHPCQALADLLTLRERFGELAGLRLAYVGDGNNVAHSLMVLGAKAGLEVVVATPAELAPAPAGGPGGRRRGRRGRVGDPDHDRRRGRRRARTRSTPTCG